MSQRNPGTPRGASSYTPAHRREAPARNKKSGPSSSLIAIASLGVLLVVILGAGWWLTQNPNTPPEPTPAPVVNVWDYASSTLNSISVQDITGTTTVQFADGRWRITQPTQEDASELQIESVSANLKTLRAQSKVSDNATDLAQFGLASPQITVTLVLSGVTPPDQKLMVGNANLDGSAYYVKSASAPAVYLVANSTLEPLRSWIETPPKAEPTATPFPTLAPTVTPTLTSTLVLSGTATMTGTTTAPTTGVITDTEPGAADTNDLLTPTP